MGLHSKLPIYKVTYDLLKKVTEATQHIPRDFKRSIGERMRDDCVDLVRLIYCANVAIDKVPYLRKLLERVQVVELMLRLSCDMRLITEKHYGQLILLTDQIGKQANGWKKSNERAPAT